MAQEGFAPSHTVPEIMPRVLVMVADTASYVPSVSHATPAAAPQPADIAPQKADSLPMGVFWWMVMRFDTTRARSSRSWLAPMSLAYTITGSEAVMP